MQEIQFSKRSFFARCVCVCFVNICVLTRKEEKSHVMFRNGLLVQARVMKAVFLYLKVKGRPIIFKSVAALN